MVVEEVGEIGFFDVMSVPRLSKVERP